MPHNRPPATHSALKVKFTDFELISRSRTLACEVGSRSELESVSVAFENAVSNGGGRQATRSVNIRILRQRDRTRRTDSLSALAVEVEGLTKMI